MKILIFLFLLFIIVLFVSCGENEYKIVDNLNAEIHITSVRKTNADPYKNDVTLSTSDINAKIYEIH